MSMTPDQIAELYIVAFNRAAEKNGLQAWANLSNARNLKIEETANLMLETPAARELYGINYYNNEAFVNEIYKNALGKDKTTDAPGVAVWTEALNNGMSKGKLVKLLIDTAKSDAARVADPTAAKILENKIHISKYMATKFNDVPKNIDGTYNFDMFKKPLAEVRVDNLDVVKASIDQLAIDNNQHSQNVKAALVEFNEDTNNDGKLDHSENLTEPSFTTLKMTLLDSGKAGDTALINVLDQDGNILAKEVVMINQNIINNGYEIKELPIKGGDTLTAEVSVRFINGLDSDKSSDALTIEKYNFNPNNPQPQPPLQNQNIKLYKGITLGLNGGNEVPNVASVIKPGNLIYGRIEDYKNLMYYKNNGLYWTDEAKKLIQSGELRDNPDENKSIHDLLPGNSVLFLSKASTLPTIINNDLIPFKVLNASNKNIYFEGDAKARLKLDLLTKDDNYYVHTGEEMPGDNSYLISLAKDLAKSFSPANEGTVETVINGSLYAMVDMDDTYTLTSGDMILKLLGSSDTAATDFVAFIELF